MRDSFPVWWKNFWNNFFYLRAESIDMPSLTCACDNSWSLCVCMCFYWLCRYGRSLSSHLLAYCWTTYVPPVHAHVAHFCSDRYERFGSWKTSLVYYYFACSRATTHRKHRYTKLCYTYERQNETILWELNIFSINGLRGEVNIMKLLDGARLGNWGWYSVICQHAYYAYLWVHLLRT